jgi:hypothetical protein
MEGLRVGGGLGLKTGKLLLGNLETLLELAFGAQGFG